MAGHTWRQLGQSYQDHRSTHYRYCCHRQDSHTPGPWLYLGYVVLHRRLHSHRRCHSRCRCRPWLGLPRVSSRRVFRPPVSAVRGTSSLTDDVVQQWDFDLKSPKSNLTIFMSSNQSQVSVKVSTTLSWRLISKCRKLTSTPRVYRRFLSIN